MLKKLLVMMAALVCVAAMAACSSAGASSSAAPASSDASAQIVGGYSEDRDVTDDDMAIFDQAMAGEVGVTYEPEKVATQVVAGTNYRFYCKSTTVTSAPEEGYAYVYIFVPLESDEVPSVTSIEPVE